MKEYKYLINEMVEKLPYNHYQKALKAIPKALGISTVTFNNYKNILKSDSQDIPHEKVIMLENLFSLPKGGLENFMIDTPSIEILLKQDERKNQLVTP
jgi:hypothetical protein